MTKQIANNPHKKTDSKIIRQVAQNIISIMDEAKMTTREKTGLLLCLGQALHKEAKAATLAGQTHD